MQSKRQSQVASIIQQSLSEILQKEGFSIYGNAFVTITGVNVTPDLLEAKVFISIFNPKEHPVVLAALKEHTSGLRRALGFKIKNKVRQIPELHFAIDDTLEKVFRIEKLLKKDQEPPAENKD